MKFLTPFILIVFSIALFVMYVYPTYTSLADIRANVVQYQSAIQQAQQASAKRDDLLNRYNSFAPTDLARLNVLLPASVNNIRLAINLNSIAALHGTSIYNINFGGSNTSAPNTGAISTYVPVSFGFSVDMKYTDFIAFLKDLESSLQFVDISSISFSPSDTGVYTYSVGLRTYMLK